MPTGSKRLFFCHAIKQNRWPTHSPAISRTEPRSAGTRPRGPPLSAPLCKGQVDGVKASVACQARTETKLLAPPFATDESGTERGRRTALRVGRRSARQPTGVKASVVWPDRNISSLPHPFAGDEAGTDPRSPAVLRGRPPFARVSRRGQASCLGRQARKQKLWPQPIRRGTCSPPSSRVSRTGQSSGACPARTKTEFPAQPVRLRRSRAEPRSAGTALRGRPPAASQRQPTGSKLLCLARHRKQKLWPQPVRCDEAGTTDDRRRCSAARPPLRQGSVERVKASLLSGENRSWLWPQPLPAMNPGQKNRRFSCRRSGQPSASATSADGGRASFVWTNRNSYSGPHPFADDEPGRYRVTGPASGQAAASARVNSDVSSLVGAYRPEQPTSATPFAATKATKKELRVAGPGAPRRPPLRKGSADGGRCAYPRDRRSGQKISLDVC